MSNPVIVFFLSLVFLSVVAPEPFAFHGISQILEKELMFNSQPFESKVKLGVPAYFSLVFPPGRWGGTLNGL